MANLECQLLLPLKSPKSPNIIKVRVKKNQGYIPPGIQGFTLQQTIIPHWVLFQPNKPRQLIQNNRKQLETHIFYIAY